jgi:hypothetical protein
LGFKPLYQRIVAVGIVLACVPLLNLPGVVTIVCAVVGLFCIVDGALWRCQRIEKE